MHGFGLIWLLFLSPHIRSVNKLRKSLYAKSMIINFDMIIGRIWATMFESISAPLKSLTTYLTCLSNHHLIKMGRGGSSNLQSQLKHNWNDGCIKCSAASFDQIFRSIRLYRFSKLSLLPTQRTQLSRRESYWVQKAFRERTMPRVR